MQKPSYRNLLNICGKFFEKNNCGWSEVSERRVEGEGREKSARILVDVYVCEKSGTTYTIQSLVGCCGSLLLLF